MSKIIQLILIPVLFIAVNQSCAAFAGDSQDKDEEPRPIKIFSLPEMPAIVAEAAFGKETAGDDASFTITNLTDEVTSRIELLVLVFDREGKFIRTEGLTCGQELLPSASEKSDFHYLDNKVKPEERVVIAVHRIIGQTGTWEVDSSKLEEAIKSFILGQVSEPLHVRHDRNLILTDTDKRELYRKALEGLLFNRRATEYLTMKETQNVILSTNDIEPRLIQKIPKINIRFMTPEEIAVKIKTDGTFGYLYFYPFTIEGRSVQVSIMYRNDIKLMNNMYQPCCGEFSFIFRKENGKWIEESSIGARI